MPLDMAAREVLSTERSMLAAAFIFLAFHGCSTTIGAAAAGTRVLLESQFGFGSVPWAHSSASRSGRWKMR